MPFPSHLWSKFLHSDGWKQSSPPLHWAVSLSQLLILEVLPLLSLHQRGPFVPARAQLAIFLPWPAKRLEPQKGRNICWMKKCYMNECALITCNSLWWIFNSIFGGLVFYWFILLICESFFTYSRLALCNKNINTIIKTFVLVYFKTHRKLQRSYPRTLHRAPSHDVLGNQRALSKARIWDWHYILLTQVQISSVWTCFWLCPCMYISKNFFLV